jgi:drug/metabolite transporter (DMT)-like permease
VITLAGALTRGDLTVVYPLARGTAPVLVLAVSAGLLGAATTPWQVAGVALVAAGIMLVRGVRRPDEPVAVALALACAAASRATRSSTRTGSTTPLRCPTCGS